jgi:PAS domain S-box-containing protein
MTNEQPMGDNGSGEENGDPPSRTATTADLAPTAYKTICNVVEDAVFVFDVSHDGDEMTFTFRENNPAHESATGMTTEEYRGMTARDFLDEQQALEVIDNYRTCVERRKSIEYEETLDHPSGTIDWQTKLTPIVENGQVTQIVGVARDITELKEHERELKRTKRRMELALKTTDSVVYESDPETDNIQTYPITNPVIGSELTSFDDFLKHVHPEDQSVVQEEAVTDEIGDSYKLEYRIQIEQEPRWVRDHGKRVSLGDDTVDLGVFTDITEQKEYERTLEEQRDNLEVLNQIIRHDIRNNLQVVLVYADMLKDSVEGDGEKSLRHILDAGREAVEITQTASEVTDVLLASGTSQAPVNLQSVLRKQIDYVRENHERALISVEETLPDVAVMADKMLDSVFRNLLNNAIVHNDKEIPEVIVSATTTEEMVQVRIADNGPGIPADQKEQIFKEGEKGLDSEGTGLGLFLVQTLVDRYGGAVWVEENDPEGSVFVVELRCEQ